MICSLTLRTILLPTSGVRGDKAVTLETNRTIPMDLSKIPVSSVKRLTWQHTQMRLFALKTVRYHLVDSTVYPLFFHPKPAAQIAIRGFKTKIAVSTPEALRDEGVRPFDLSFQPSLPYCHETNQASFCSAWALPG